MNPDDFLEQHLDIIEDQGIPPEERRDINNPRTLQQFKNYDRCFYQKLNAEQKQFVDQVMTATGHFRSLNPDQYFDPTRVKTVEHVFNLKGDGGTGKSFTENVIYTINTL
jgi:RecA-family ATPase